MKVSFKQDFFDKNNVYYSAKKNPHEVVDLEEEDLPASAEIHKESVKPAEVKKETVQTKEA